MLRLTIPPQGRVQIGNFGTIINNGKENARIGFEFPLDVQILRENAKVKVPRKTTEHLKKR